MIEFITDIGSMVGAWVHVIFWIVAIFAVLGVVGMFVKKGNNDEDSKIRDLEGLKTLSKKTCVVRSVAHDRRATTRAQTGKPIAVIRFEGDVMASQRTNLAMLVNEVLFNKDRIAKAIVVVNSPGGAVPHYGQAFAELERLRKAGIEFEVCVDTFAASGGYLMSLPANKIIAAPFAIVGSIGVVAQMMNFHQFLKNFGIEPLLFTAGQFKRTVTSTGAITEEGKAHFQGELERIHQAFGALVAKYRDGVDIDRVTTGEHWSAQESVELGLNLVDEIATSHEYLYAQNGNRDLVTLSIKKDPKSKLVSLLSASMEMAIEKVMTKLSSNGITG